MKIRDKKDKLDIQGILKEGAKTKFWEVITDALKESIQELQNDQDRPGWGDAPPEQYKMEMELFRAKKRFLNTLINTPENIISWLEDPKSDTKEFDPYDKS